MELDKRFKVLPFCCFGTDKKAITNHIGKKGYFANLISSFRDIRFCQYGTLGSVLGDQQESFCMNESGATFSFFIPECFVKPKEKQYRPYTIEEFCNEGFEIVVFRNKNDDSLEYHVRYNGYIKSHVNHNDYLYIILGNVNYTLKLLFDDFEYLDDDGEWKPFGVEE